MAGSDAKDDDDGKSRVPAPPPLSFDPPGRRRGAGLPRPSSAPEPEVVEDPLAALLSGGDTGLDPEDMRTRPYPSVASAVRPRKRPPSGPRKTVDAASDSMTKPIVDDADDDDDIASLVAAAQASAKEASSADASDGVSRPGDRAPGLPPRVSSSGSLPRRDPTSIGAAGLPRGMKPPAGVVEEVIHDDTDVLIAEAAAELIRLHPEPEPEPEPEPAAPPDAAPASDDEDDDDVAAAPLVAAHAAAPASAAAAAVAPSTPPPATRGLPWLWIGVGAFAATAVVAFLLFRPDPTVDDEPQARAHVAAPNDAPPVSESAAEKQPPAEEEPAAVAIADRLDLGGPRLDLGPRLDVPAPEGDTDDGTATDGDPNPIDPDAVADATPQPAPSGNDREDRGASAAPRPGTKRRKTGAEARKPPPPKPSGSAKPAPAGPNAASLLADAKAAFKKGRSSEAYALASKSNSKKRSESALRIMARAACRMKSKSKAKSAFDKLSVGGRKGIRGECRDRGIRLGL